MKYHGLGGFTGLYGVWQELRWTINRVEIIIIIIITKFVYRTNSSKIDSETLRYLKCVTGKYA